MEDKHGAEARDVPEIRLNNGEGVNIRQELRMWLRLVVGPYVELGVSLVKGMGYW